MENNRKGGFHYAWVILAACCLLQSAITGVVQNGRGIFYNPVCSDLGFEVSSFTLYSLFHGVSSFLCMPFAAKFCNRFHPRISITAAALVFCGSTALLGSMSTLPGFYLAGTLQGVFGGLLIFYICPILVGNWFDRHYGFAMGLYAAFSGLAGVIINPLLNGVIERLGWRMGYRVQGLAAFALALPAAMLIKSLKPEDVGLRRLGEGERKAGGPSDAEIAAAAAAPATKREKQVLALAIAFTLFSAIINAYCQHFAKYAASIGLTAAVGALLVSCTMAGNIVSKFGIGVLNDRIGSKRTLILSCVTCAVGFGGTLLAIPSLLYPAAVLSGICMPLCSLCVPMLTKYLYGAARYKKFYPTVTSVCSLASSAGITVLSVLYEIRYSYVPVFLIGIGLCLLCILTIVVADRLAHGKSAAH